VSAAGGIAAPATELIKGERGHHWPQFLADGRHFLFEQPWHEPSALLEQEGKAGLGRGGRGAVLQVLGGGAQHHVAVDGG